MAELTEEKRLLMNELFRTSIAFRRSQREAFSNLSPASLKKLLFFGDKLDIVLTKINNGKLPYSFTAPAAPALQQTLGKKREKEGGL